MSTSSGTASYPPYNPEISPTQYQIYVPPPTSSSSYSSSSAGSSTASKVEIPSQTYTGQFPGITNALLFENVQTSNDTSTPANSYVNVPVSFNVIGSTTFNATNSGVGYNENCTLFLDKPVAGTNVNFPSGAFSLITSGGIYAQSPSVFNHSINMNYSDLQAVYSITVVAGGNNVRLDGSLSTTATAGTAVLPSAPAGFMNFSINGTVYKLPYYPS